MDRLDRVYANCVDQIALGGQTGVLFCDAVHIVLGEQPDPTIVAWVLSEVRKRSPVLFTSPDFDALPLALHIIACESLCNRAFGYNILEHANIQPHARLMLEAVGRAGPNGVLQSDLATMLNLSPVMVHHYLGSLLVRQLVAKKKVVLTRKKRGLANPSISPAASSARPPPSPAASSSQPDARPDKNVDSTQPYMGPLLTPDKSTSLVTVTYTAVIVLSRFEAFITNTNLSKTFASIQNGAPVPAPGAPAAAINQIAPPLSATAEANATSVSIIDVTGDVRMHRIIEALRPSNVRAERDLKIICMPDSERTDDVTLEIFRRKRHRTYRTLRARLIRLGLARLVKRQCRTNAGKLIGWHPCLTLTELGKEDNALEDAFRKKNHSGGYGMIPTTAEIQRANTESKYKASSLLPRDFHPILESSELPALAAEVDIIQQVYNVMVSAGAKGISVPELDAYFDAGTGLSGMPQKRIRNIIKAISRKEPTIESQLFEGKTMFVRFALARFVNPTGEANAADGTLNADGTTRITPLKRRKSGITTLGEQRQEIIMGLLEEKKVIVIESLGREVARVEKSGLVRVDQKVMRRITNDLVERRKVRIITATKPSIKENKRWHTIRLVALPDVREDSEEVRRVITTTVDRALYGSGTNEEPARGVKVKKEDLESGEEGSDLDTAGKKSRMKRACRVDTISGVQRPAREGAADGIAGEESEGDDEIVVIETVVDRKKKTDPKITAPDDLEIVDGDEIAESEDEGANIDGPAKKKIKRRLSVSFVEATNPDQALDTNLANGSNENEANTNDEPGNDEPSNDEPGNDIEVSEIEPKNPELKGNTPRSAMAGPKKTITRRRRGSATQKKKTCRVQKKRTNGEPASDPQMPDGAGYKKDASVNPVQAGLRGSDADPDVIEVEVQPSTSGGKAARTKRVICVQNGARDSRKARVGRLRAIDYGWVKGTMARSRLFHKLLFKITTGSKSGDGKDKNDNEANTDGDGDRPAASELRHVSIVKAKSLPSIGKFTIYSCLREMTVGEYAATVGLCHDHGCDLIDTIREERVEDVTNIVQGEIMSDHASRRIKGLVQHLTKLGLIESKEDSFWALSGGGIIRDYGQGMPPGVSPHGVPFMNKGGVDLFWKELRQFSHFKMPKGHTLVPWKFDSGKDERDWNMRDVYRPPCWDTGLYQDFPPYEQILFESVLQRLCGVEICVETLDISVANVITKPLRTFGVEELIDELDRVAEGNSYVGKRQRYAAMSEGLLRYSRMRSQSSISKHLIKPGGFGGQLAEMKGTRNVVTHGKSSVLRVKRKGSDFKSEEVLRAMSSVTRNEHRRQGKAILKKKLKVDESPVVSVEGEMLIPLLRSIIRRGSIAYCCEDGEVSDWRKVATLVHSEHITDVPDPAMEKEETAYRAVTGLCHCLMLRSSFDILSLQIVLRVRELAESRLISSTGLLPANVMTTLIDEVLKGWDRLDVIIDAIMMEVKEEVFREWRVKIEDSNPGRSSIQRSSLRRSLLENYFDLRLRETSSTGMRPLTNVISVLATRYRRIANLRLRQNIEFGLLLSDDQYEEGEDEVGVGRKKGSAPLSTSFGDRVKKRKTSQGEGNIESKVGVIGDTGEIINSAIDISKCDSKCDRSNGSKVKPCSEIRTSKDSTDGKGLVEMMRVELAEIIVATVLRQSRYEQWSKKSRDVLKRADANTLSLARDRFLLRGTIALLEDYDGRGRHLSVCKVEKNPDCISILYEENAIEAEDEWRKDMMERIGDATDGDANMLDTKIFQDIRSFLPKSTFASNVMTRMLILGQNKEGFEFRPLFTKDEEGKPKECIVKVRSKPGNRIAENDKPVEVEQITSRKATPSELSEWMGDYVKSSGWQGVTMEELLQKVTDEGRRNLERKGEDVIEAIREICGNGKVRRVAIGTYGRQWDFSDGGVFIRTEFCKVLKCDHGYLDSWRSVDGRVDVELVRDVATALVDTIMKRPWIGLADAILSTGERFGWLPRRGIADLLFGLLRRGFVNVDYLEWGPGHWVSCDAGSTVSDVDSLAAVCWGRNICVNLKAITGRFCGGRLWAGSDKEIISLVDAIGGNL